MATQDTILLVKHGPIPKFDQLEHLILGSEEEEPKDVVLFGEGNFTFSIALASLVSQARPFRVWPARL